MVLTFLTHPLISFFGCIVAADFIALVQSNAKMGPLQRPLLQSFAFTNATLSIFWARAWVAHFGVPSSQMAMTLLSIMSTVIAIAIHSHSDIVDMAQKAVGEVSCI